MLDWLTRRQTFFGKATHKADASTSPKPIWELPMATPPNWSPAETRTLTECVRHKTICSITNGAYEAPRQTLVLGCDTSNNQLLLDDFFPRPSRTPIGERFQLNLPLGKGMLMLQVVVRDEIGAAPTPVYVAEVVEKTVVTDRRLNPRLHFPSSAAPRVDLLVPFSPHLGGHLLDISEGGFAMVFYGSTKPKLFTRSGDCRINFDAEFVLRPKVVVQQVRSHRKPFHHTIIRVRFAELSAAERERLKVFIQDCSSAQTRDLSAA
jgi:hypothetical protein